MKKKIVSMALGLTLAVSMAFAIQADENATATAKVNTEKKAKYVLYFIGDGLGTAQRQMAEYYLQETSGDKSAKLAMNSLPHAAVNTTHSSDTLVTDSAAAGTALATGHKTNNGVISQTPDGKVLKTIVELAEEKGIATGIATTTRVTHATPAVFISHNENRGNENEIAADFLDSGVDYLVGGGVRHFLPQGFKDSQTDAFGKTIKSKRKDDRNVIQEFKSQGYRVDYGMFGAKSFKKYTPKANDKYVGLFTYSHLPYTVDTDNTSGHEVPTLAEITKKGIELLSKDEDGFFFMIESGRIDHACHPNDTASTLQDTLAFDDAIKEGIKFYNEHPEETLIVVVGDHETGGLGLGTNKDYFVNLDTLSDDKMSMEEFKEIYSSNKETFYNQIKEYFGLTDLTEDEIALIDKALEMDAQGLSNDPYGFTEPVKAIIHIVSKRAGVYWTSYAHTATQIPMGSMGVGAEEYNGFIDNTDIAKITAELMGLELK